MAFARVNSRSPSAPWIRPNPDSPTPPNDHRPDVRRVDRSLGPPGLGTAAAVAGFSEPNVFRVGADPGPGSCAWDAVMAVAILACWPHAHTEVLTKNQLTHTEATVQ